MAYRKLTKKQHKNRQRILARLNNEEFKENSRASQQFQIRRRQGWKE